MTAPQRKCRVCGCTDDDCSQCVARTGVRCSWVAADLCSACSAPPHSSPGPWLLVETCRIRRAAVDFQVLDSRGDPVGQLYSGFAFVAEDVGLALAEVRANGRLFAAAPALYTSGVAAEAVMMIAAQRLHHAGDRPLEPERAKQLGAMLAYHAGYLRAATHTVYHGGGK